VGLGVRSGGSRFHAGTLSDDRRRQPLPPFTLFVVTLGLGALFALALEGNVVTALGGWLSLSLTFRFGQIVGREEAA